MKTRLSHSRGGPTFLWKECPRILEQPSGPGSLHPGAGSLRVGSPSPNQGRCSKWQIAKWWQGIEKKQYSEASDIPSGKVEYRPGNHDKDSLTEPRFKVDAVSWRRKEPSYHNGTVHEVSPVACDKVLSPRLNTSTLLLRLPDGLSNALAETKESYICDLSPFWQFTHCLPNVHRPSLII